MSIKYNARKQFRKGDDMVVTIEDIADGCVIVSMLHQNRKFCGALMDTSERRGPYGIPNIYEEEKKMETRKHQQTSKKCTKTPFPEPLLTRKSYNLELKQPPERNIYRRIRRSRRKARSNILKQAKDDFKKSNELLDLDGFREYGDDSHAFTDQSHPSSTSTVPVKRKAKDFVEEVQGSKKLKLQDDTPSTSSDGDSVGTPEELASPIKNLIPRKTHIPELQRSPVIKITFKSPGGRGRVVKIPSKLHNSPKKPNQSPVVNISSNNQIKSVSSRNKEAKMKSGKRNVIAKNDIQSLKTTATSGTRKYVRKKIPVKTQQIASVCAWDEVKNAPAITEPSDLVKSKRTKQNVTAFDKRKLKNTKKKVVGKSNLKKAYEKDADFVSVVEIKKKLFKKLSSTDSSKSVVEVKKKPIKKLFSDHSPKSVVEVKQRLSSEKLLTNYALESVVEVKQKSRKLSSKKANEKQARKVLNRAERSPPITVPFEAFLDTKLSKDIFSPKPSMASSPDRNKHLRVVLEPLEGKNGLTLGEISPRDSFIYHSFGPEKTTSPLPSLNPDNKLTMRKSRSPQSHTIYVTTCKSLKGTVFTQGDVVWGKLRGHPWWPSRIVKLIITKTDGKVLQQEAMVGWFRSPTTSIIPLHSVQSFRKHYNLRFDKKRKGVYQKAVSDAEDALKEISPEVRKLISQFETS